MILECAAGGFRDITRIAEATRCDVARDLSGESAMPLLVALRHYHDDLGRVGGGHRERRRQSGVRNLARASITRAAFEPRSPM